MQHFYHIEVMMLSFIHRRDYCWKCEFDTGIKIENYNHHDGEQLLFCKKNTYQTTEQKVGCSCNRYIIARNEEFQFIW